MTQQVPFLLDLPSFGSTRAWFSSPSSHVCAVLQPSSLSVTCELGGIESGEPSDGPRCVPLQTRVTSHVPSRPLSLHTPTARDKRTSVLVVTWVRAPWCYSGLCLFSLPPPPICWRVLLAVSSPHPAADRSSPFLDCRQAWATVLSCLDNCRSLPSVPSSQHHSRATPSTSLS